MKYGFGDFEHRLLFTCSPRGTACVHSWVVVIRAQEEVIAVTSNPFLSLSIGGTLPQLMISSCKTDGD
jgi:hypothetical protein